MLVLIASLLAGVGHVMLAKGMKTIGDMTEASSSSLRGMMANVAVNPWVILGVTFQASFFVMYLILLSRADVSQVLPMTAVDYLVVVFMAQFVLDEIVTPIRWMGAGLIAIGVFMVWRT